MIHTIHQYISYYDWSVSIICCILYMTFIVTIPYSSLTRNFNLDPEAKPFLPIIIQIKYTYIYIYLYHRHISDPLRRPLVRSRQLIGREIDLRARCGQHRWEILCGINCLYTIIKNTHTAPIILPIYRALYR